MLPTRNKEATLVDILNKLFDKGLVLKAELLITLADVPLIAINLNAMIAGSETMIDYGMIKERDILEKTSKPVPIES